MDLVPLSKEELELTFADYLIDEIGTDGWAKLLGDGRGDPVADAINRSVAGEPPPPRPVTNAHGYTVFLMPLVVTGRLDPNRAPEAAAKVDAEFACYATPWQKACADRLTAKAAAILAADGGGGDRAA